MKSRNIPAVYSLHTKAILDVPVVREYEDVFPEELPGLPPDRDVELVINLVPGMALIAQSPYRMAEVELKQLKAELDSLLEKGFIRQVLHLRVHRHCSFRRRMEHNVCASTTAP
jgi:hypothetical protein